MLRLRSCGSEAAAQKLRIEVRAELDSAKVNRLPPSQLRSVTV